MVGTFPLNVQEGSPQYTLTSQIAPTSSTTTISVTNTDSIEPISNAYYTIQNEDGSKWCTFYISQWTTDSANNYTGTCTYSSSNTSDVFPEGSVCWCIWCKEYYDSLITQIGSSGNTVKVSQLEWDTNLIIPRGYSIESASSEVQTNGNLWVGGSVAVEETIECADLITSPNGVFSNLNVGGYTSKVLSSNASISINGTGLSVIPITPSPISVSGTARISTSSTYTQTVYITAICYTPVGSSSITLGSGWVRNGSNTMTLDGQIPANTFMVKVDYSVHSDYNPSARVDSVNITSTNYTSKCLI